MSVNNKQWFWKFECFWDTIYFSDRYQKIDLSIICAVKLAKECESVGITDVIVPVFQNGLTYIWGTPLFFTKLSLVYASQRQKKNIILLHLKSNYRRLGKGILKITNQTYPADCRKIAAVDSNKHDWDWTNRIYWKKKIFVQKYFF